MSAIPPRRVGAGQPLSLRARLLWMVALSTAVVVGGSTYVENRIAVGELESEALEAAGATAVGVAAELTERQALPSPDELEELRIEFSKAVPALRALTITRQEGDQSVVEASTEAVPSADAGELGQSAIRQRELVVSPEGPSPLRLVAVPLEREHRPYGAVVVTMSLDAMERVRRRTRAAALVFAPVAILGLTGLIDSLARRLVYTPLAGIHQTMERAAGDLKARARVYRADEIGAVAQGLNGMLDRMGDFNVALRDEVERATQELQERNRQLLESAQRLFAVRRELARSEQLAVAGQMAASVAHQIGTPLNLISGYVQMILEELPKDSAAVTRLRGVQQQIGRVTTIVQGLLDQVRRPVPRKRPASATELVSTACELARPTLEAAGIALHTSIEPGLPLVEVDVGLMEQAFLNLITNAIDALERSGVLTLSVRVAPSAGVEFEFADTGCGIAPEDLGRVFDPLFTTKRLGKGTGLGLTIVRDIVVAHGGLVRIASQPGHGTAVTVTLPPLEDASEAHA